MRFFLFLLVVFIASFAITVSDEMKHVKKYASIAESPGFTQGTVDRITKTMESRGGGAPGQKRGVGFSIYFKYEVDGVTYRMSYPGAHRRSDDKNAEPSSESYKLVNEVVYDTRNPSVSVMRQDYEDRDKRTVGRALFYSGAFSLIITLLVVLVIRRLGWFGRK